MKPLYLCIYILAGGIPIAHMSFSNVSLSTGAIITGGVQVGSAYGELTVNVTSVAVLR